MHLLPLQSYKQLIIMNYFEEDQYHIWRIKLELAKEGSAQAIQDIRNHIIPNIPQKHTFHQANYTKLLADSNIHTVAKQTVHATYQLYSNVPTFILLQGKAVIQCINTQGENETLCQLQKPGILELNQNEIKIKYGQSNIGLLTQFQILAVEKSILIQLAPNSLLEATSGNTEQTTLREEAIMRKYMLIALKNITKFNYTKGKTITSKFYLLQGKACYFNKKSKLILCCYEQGLFTPSHLQGTNRCLFIFQGAYLMLMEQQMLKDQVITGLQAKRQQHLDIIEAKYGKMANQERSKMQELLIQKYALPRKEVQKDILCIVKPQSRLKTNKELVRTSSSMKDKCSIRIRKSQKSK